MQVVSVPVTWSACWPTTTGHEDVGAHGLHRCSPVSWSARNELRGLFGGRAGAGECCGRGIARNAGAFMVWATALVSSFGRVLSELHFPEEAVERCRLCT